MSVTFRSNATRSTVHVKEACLCAQMAPGWLHAAAEVLQAHASPECQWCAGTGLEVAQRTDEPQLNVANENARALLALLVLSDELYGEVTLDELRRVLVRVRATFTSRAAGLTRAQRVVRGSRTREDGVTELVVVAWHGGLSEETLARYMTDLQALVDYAAERGGTVISWG